MKNIENWKPTKFVHKNNKLIGSRDTNQLGVGSRLIADIVASFYGKYLKEYASGKLLDLGCGYVPLYEAYKDYVSDNICVDWANTLHKNTFLDFEADLTKPLDLPSNEFDIIILSDVLEHIPNPEQLWSEMYRVLKPGGIIILNVPFFYPIHEKPFDFYRYTEYALKRFVEDAGLQLDLLKPVGGLPEVLVDIFSKILAAIPLIGGVCSSTVQKVFKIFAKSQLGLKISNKTSEHFPLGYFLIARKLH